MHSLLSPHLLSSTPLMKHYTRKGGLYRMALITKWPDSTSSLYDNKQWNWNEWAIGSPITQSKLENLENGVGILATQMKAVLGEFNPSSLDGVQLNASRLDKVQEWITGGSATIYSGTNIASRLNSIETLNTQQNNKLAAIISEIGGTGSDGSSTIYGGTSRIDKNDNKIAAIAAELGGGTPDGTSTTYPTAATRLDDLEKEIGGTRSAGNGYTNSRIDTLENTTSAHTTKLSAIATEIWGTDTTSGDSRIDKLTTEIYGSNVADYSATSRIDSAITKLSAITIELYGSDSTSVTSRLNDLEKEIGGTRATGSGYTNSRIDSLESHDSTLDKAIAAIKNEIGGTYVENTGFTTSRIDNLQKWITGDETGSYNKTIDSDGSNSVMKRLDTIDSTDTAQNNKLAAIMNELGGTGSDGTTDEYGGTSRLDSVISEVWGTNIISDNSRIDNIETHDASVDKAIAAIKAEIGGTYVEDNGFTNSRIDDIEALNTTQNERLDSIEDESSAQNTKITAIATEIWGSDTTSGNSKLDTIITEIYGSNNTSVFSRLDDLEKEICGSTITRTPDGTGYTNSRIDSLELKVGDGAIGTDNDISAAIRRLSDTVAALDPTGSAEAVGFLVSEVWGQPFSEDTDFAADSRIDILEATTTSHGSQIAALASRADTIQSNLESTDAKIPIELYIATNSSASDAIVLDAAPRDKSIFFVAVPHGTLGTNNLTLQTNDIQFNNVQVNRTYSGDGMQIKYAAGSLISIYRNGSNAYAYNVPMVL